MSHEDAVRRYLRQRREVGDKELVLETMDGDDALRAARAGSGTVGRTMPLETPRPARPVADPEPPTGDWRSVLRAADAGPNTPAAAPAARPRARDNALASAPVTPAPGSPIEAARPVPPAPVRGRRLEFDPPVTGEGAPPALIEVPPGIVIGSEASDLFGSSLGALRTLDDVATQVAGCQLCSLYETAKRPVPGEGSPTARLVCVGEAPGATEDETGRPFVGPAGQLLTRILAAIDLKREDVFICNVLKHRPPDNRNPRPDEIKACSPYLLRQLEILRPRLILALGTFAAQTLLDTNLSMGKLRGAIHRYYGVPLIVTYHPAALLRNPGWRRPTWEDVQLARRILDSAGA